MSEREGKVFISAIKSDIESLQLLIVTQEEVEEGSIKDENSSKTNFSHEMATIQVTTLNMYKELPQS